jgi:hypothetical protein
MPAATPTNGASRRLDPTSRARLVLVASAVLTIALYVVPYGHVLAWPLILVSTLAHELGHGVAALLVGGRFEALRMWADGSGMAIWSGDPGRLARAFVAAGGLVGPAIAAAACFVAGRRPRGARTCLLLVAAALLVAVLLVVRSLFGFVFVLALAGVLLLVATRGGDGLSQATLVFLAVQLALSVFSRGDYLFVRAATTAEGVAASDVAQIAAALLLPYWFWGAVCGAFSVAVLVLGVVVFWKR